MERKRKSNLEQGQFMLLVQVCDITSHIKSYGNDSATRGANVEDAYEVIQTKSIGALHLLIAVKKVCPKY